MNPATLRALLEGDFENALVAATPGGIEAQEAAGQHWLANSTMLPIQTNGCTDAQLEQMGIKLGDPMDNLFREAILPPGWEKVPTNHSMWSKLLDEKGRERASIFYKAAFYARDAFVGLSRRYSYRTQYPDPYDYDTSPIWCVVTDGDKILWQSEELAPNEELRPYEVSDQLSAQGKAWLDEHYPNWQDPLAYWD